MSHNLTAGSGGIVREVLTASRTYYVRKDGNDNNKGLADSAAGAFLTIQKAVDKICKTLDLTSLPPAGVVTIQVGAGTYNEQILMSSVLGQDARTTECLVLKGNPADPSTVVVVPPTTGSGNAIVIIGGLWQVDGITVDMSAANNWVQAFCVTEESGSNSVLGVGRVAIKGATPSRNHIAFGAWSGATIRQSYSVDCSLTFDGGGYYSVINADYGSLVNFSNQTVTFLNSPSWGNFITLDDSSTCIFYSNTITGTGTGKRFTLVNSSALTTFGSGASYIPGTIAGTTDAGSTYDGIPTDAVTPQSAVIGLPAVLSAIGISRSLSTDEQFYASPTGSDTTGTGAAGAPWQTIQHAFDELAKINFNGHTPQLNLAAGTYTGHNYWRGGPNHYMDVKGDIVTPSNVVVVGSFNVNTPNTGMGVGGVRVDMTTFGDYYTAFNSSGVGCFLEMDDKIEVVFATGKKQRMAVANNKAALYCYANTTIFGDTAQDIMGAYNGSLADLGATITFNSALAVAFAVFGVDNNSVGSYYGGFAGATPTGRRFRMASGGMMNTYGSGYNVFPGTVAGIMEDSCAYDGVTGLEFNGKISVSTGAVTLSNTGAAKTAAYAATSSDGVIAVDTTAGGVTITLPAAPTNGETHYIKKVSTDGNSLTIDGNGKLIDGTATQVFAGTNRPSATVTYIGAQSAWYLV